MMVSILVGVMYGPTHLIGEGGGFFVTLFLVPAGGTGVIVVEIAAMGPAVIRVGVETGIPGFVFVFSYCIGCQRRLFSGYRLDHLWQIRGPSWKLRRCMMVRV